MNITISMEDKTCSGIYWTGEDFLQMHYRVGQDICTGWTEIGPKGKRVRNSDFNGDFYIDMEDNQ